MHCVHDEYLLPHERQINIWLKTLKDGINRHISTKFDLGSLWLGVCRFYSPKKSLREGKSKKLDNFMSTINGWQFFKYYILRDGLFKRSKCNVLPN